MNAPPANGSSAGTSAPSTPEVVRWPISLKIFGISSTLLALMIVVTVLTSINFRQVGEQLTVLSDHYIGLDQLMSDVRSEGLREAIQIERVLQARPKIGAVGEAEATALYKEAGDCSPVALRPVQDKLRAAYPGRSERRLMRYWLARLCINQWLDRAAKAAEAALALPQVQAASDQVMRFTEIKSEIAYIGRAREKLHASFEKYLVDLRAGRKPAMTAAEERIDEHRGEVNRRIRAVTQSLHEGTRQSAQLVHALERKTRWLSWLVTLVACTLGLLFAGLITRSLVRPVRELLGLTKSIQMGNLDVRIEIRTADEIGQLADSFNHMVGELRKTEEIKRLFGTFVDPRVVQRLLVDPKQFVDGGERQMMSVFFSDIEGFTTVAEDFTPTATVHLLNRYFSLVAESIRTQQGIIDKYIGDSVMAFWGPPFCKGEEQATRACAAALAQQVQIIAFRSQLPEIVGRRVAPRINVRMAIATGDVIVGSIGSDDARGYTVIGDTVNLASRLEGANKRYGTQILIDGETRRRAGEAIEAREIDTVRVAGKVESTHIYELIGHKGHIPPRIVELRNRYEHGLAQFRKRAFAEAAEAFEGCLAIDPADGPSRVFVERIRSLDGQTLPEQWDGVFTFLEK
jgi:adenylate cyclase